MNDCFGFRSNMGRIISFVADYSACWLCFYNIFWFSEERYTAIISAMNDDFETINQCHYIFLDEGGNLDFSGRGSDYFTLTAVTKSRPFAIETNLLPLKYDLIESGLNIEYFHASEDRQAVRNQVFDCITGKISKLRIDAIITRKKALSSDIQHIEKLYPLTLGTLLQDIVENITAQKDDGIIVITDTLPLKSKRKAVEKGIKTTLKRMLGKDRPYRVLHHSSRSPIGLQIADYCNWAIFRKWEGSDTRSYDLIAPAICQELLKE